MLPLTTARLELRDFRPDDFEDVHRYASDPAVVAYMPWGPNDRDATREFLARVRASAAESPRVSFELAVVERASGRVIGGCGLHPRRLAHHEWELGYVLARSHHRQGFGREAAAALVEAGFGPIGAHRIFACVDTRNAASAALLRSLGFRLEGLQRADTWMRGTWRDSLVFARLAPEPASPHAVADDARDLRLEVTEEPAPHDVAALERGLSEHALPATGTPGFRPLAVFARDAAGRLVGGAVARVNWSWLHVSLLWVDAAHRHGGLGSRLLRAIETEGIRRGCRHAHLDTFSYQARPFYERHGYSAFGRLDDYPPGHQRHWLRKRLADAAEG